MVKRTGVFVVLLVAALVAALPTASASAPVVKTAESWRRVTGGARDYWLYVPAGTVPTAGRPMVVYLHGCAQNNDTDPQVAFGTRWNELAAKVGAVVLYPLQADYDTNDPSSAEGNGGSCWNWFLNKNMHRGRGEPAVVAALTRDLAADNRVDRSRIFVMGASAGANMANILGITYPDVYAASAMFAGCAYAYCRDLLGNQAAKEVAKSGRSSRPAIVFQGDSDTLNNVALGKTLLQQHLGMRNITGGPRTTQHHGDVKEVNPGAGNPCLGQHGNWPCLAGASGWSSYPYTVKRYADKTRRTAVEWWLIHGLEHNYPNGDYRSTFTDPAGPDITRAAWDFFSAA